MLLCCFYVALFTSRLGALNRLFALGLSGEISTRPWKQIVLESRHNWLRNVHLFPSLQICFVTFPPLLPASFILLNIYYTCTRTHTQSWVPVIPNPYKYIICTQRLFSACNFTQCCFHLSFKQIAYFEPILSAEIHPKQTFQSVK